MNFMPDVFLLVLFRHGWRKRPSPLGMRMMKYAVFYNMNYAAHANFDMLCICCPIRFRVQKATTRTFPHHHSRAAGQFPGHHE